MPISYKYNSKSSGQNYTNKLTFSAFQHLKIFDKILGLHQISSWENGDLKQCKTIVWYSDTQIKTWVAT